MDEALREWKVQFNVGDAAYLALRNILMHHRSSLGASQCAPVDTASLQRQPSQFPEGITGHDWLAAAAQAESLFLDSSALGVSQMTNQVEFHLPVVNTGRQPQTHISDSDRATKSSISCIQSNGQLSSGPNLENDSIATYSQAYHGSAPSNTSSDWRVYSNAANQWDAGFLQNQWDAGFLQDQRPAWELGNLDMLQVGTLEPWKSTTNQFRPDFHPTTLSDKHLSNCDEVKKTPYRDSTKRPSKRKRGTSDPSAPDRSTKRILACVRCWITKKKVSGDFESGYPNTNTSAYIP